MNSWTSIYFISTNKMYTTLPLYWLRSLSYNFLLLLFYFGVSVVCLRRAGMVYASVVYFKRVCGVFQEHVRCTCLWFISGTGYCTHVGHARQEGEGSCRGRCRHWQEMKTVNYKSKLEKEMCICLTPFLLLYMMH